MRDGIQAIEVEQSEDVVHMMAACRPKETLICALHVFAISP